MFGDELDDQQLAEKLVQLATDPEAWLSQGYRLKQVADAIIDNWLDASRDVSRLSWRHYLLHLLPMSLEMERGESRPPGPRHGERRLKRAMAEAQSRMMWGATEVYMMTAGLSVENLAKGLYINAHPEAVNSVEEVERGAPVLKGLPRGGHGIEAMLRAVGVDFEETPWKVVSRLEFAVVWSGKYPIPLRSSTTRLDPVPDDEGVEGESASPSYFSSRFRSSIDGIYLELHRRMLEVAPHWVPWWEPMDEFP